jgi:glycosyltransferase involved in cell wall biosynthesis
VRVLHLYSGNLYGGVETMLASVARHRQLCPEMEPHFGLCFEGRLRDELTAAGARVHLLGHTRVSRPWTVWRARWRLGELLRKERIDVAVCHSCWPHALFAKVARRQKTPLVFWARDLPTGRHWLERWARRRPPDLLLANSKVTLSAALIHLFPRTPGEVVYNPLSAADLPDAGSVRRRVRASLGEAEDAVVILLASRLERWKGHGLLLEALARLREAPGWVCWLAGGAQRPHEEAYLRELQDITSRHGLAGRVRFLGQRSDVPELLAAADVHCQPNTGPEPFGNAFIEALYAGLPVVTTALGGALEIVDETCGVLVTPDEPGRLAEALGGLVRDAGLRARLGAAGPHRARHLCDPARQLGRIHQVLDDLLKRRRTS